MYASIVPRVPHALHMPSHIFIRLGMWPEAIESNLASADAAQDYTAKKSPGATSIEELHAWDYIDLRLYPDRAGGEGTCGR